MGKAASGAQTIRYLLVSSVPFCIVGWARKPNFFTRALILGIFDSAHIIIARFLATYLRARSNECIGLYAINTYTVRVDINIRGDVVSSFGVKNAERTSKRVTGSGGRQWRRDGRRA